jgi:hypothetical protein
MGYQSIVNAIRDAAESVNATGTFIHGVKPMQSLEYGSPFPQIFLDPFETTVIDNKFTVENHNVMIAFLDQDAPDSSVTEQEAILAAMDALCNQFMQTFNDNVGTVTGIKKVPAYRIFSGTVTGMILSFTCQSTVSPC